MSSTNGVAERSSKTVCVVSKGQFKAEGKPMVVSIPLPGGAVGKLALVPREFQTGSFGWYAGDKLTLEIAGVPVKVQVGITMTVIGSKDAPA